MTCLKPLAKRRLTHHVQLQSLVGEDIVGAPEEIVRLNLKTIDVKSLESITVSLQGHFLWIWCVSLCKKYKILSKEDLTYWSQVTLYIYMVS